MYQNSVTIAKSTTSSFTIKPQDQCHSEDVDPNDYTYPVHNSFYTNVITFESAQPRCHPASSEHWADNFEGENRSALRRSALQWSLKEMKF